MTVAAKVRSWYRELGWPGCPVRQVLKDRRGRLIKDVQVAR
jgi:hypothetical protein